MSHVLQQSVESLGEIMPPLTAAGPDSVTGEMDLTQQLTGTLDDGTASTRGLDYAVSPNTPNSANTTQVAVGTPMGDYTVQAPPQAATAG